MKNFFQTQTVVDSIKNYNQAGIKPVQLFGQYIIQGEINILFARSNDGKTMLGMDIANCIAGGTCYWPKQMSEINLPTDYYDFELNDAQFGSRYAGAAAHFSPNLRRISIDAKEYCLGGDLVREFSDSVILSQGLPTPPKMIFVDNISYILETASISVATKLMKEMKRLKERFGLTICILAHTVKTFKPGKPIDETALGGSKMVYTLCDSAIAIGSSILGPDVKYLKHLKARSVAKVEKVATIETRSTPYLHFEFIEMTDEINHLKEQSSRASIKPEDEIMIMALRDEGLSIRDIAASTGLSKSVIGRFVKDARI